MKSQIITQTLAQVKSQRMLTTVSVIGTTLSIFLIMVVVMLQQVNTAPFAPESNRNRLLHAQYGSQRQIEKPQYQSNGPMSYKTAYELYGKLTSAEAATIYQSVSVPVNLQAPGHTSFGSDIRAVDDKFWKIFDFRFLSGKPFDKAAFDSERAVAVIDESSARRLFGTIDATGREFMINHAPFTVCGVVKDVSTLASSAFSHVWIPITASHYMEYTWNYGLMGYLSATILAASSDDFDKIRTECDRRLEEFNKGISETGWEFISRGRPYTQEQTAISKWANEEPDVKEHKKQMLIVYLILLIVPAINLSSMTESRMRRRTEEMGVRRAFGCKRRTLLAQLFSENLLITLVAGLLGWGLSIAFALLFSTEMFSKGYSTTSSAPTIDLSMLVQPSTLFLALLFCFILNLLSSGIPAWRASRTNIVNAINKH